MPLTPLMASISRHDPCTFFLGTPSSLPTSAQVEWRFLAHALDDQPGFSTAWLRQQSLKKQADSREREYKEQALHGFAEEFGMTSLFPAHPAKSAQERDNGGGEDDDDANDNADLKNTPVPSRMAPDAPSFHLDRQVPTEAIIWLVYKHTVGPTTILRLWKRRSGRC